VNCWLGRCAGHLHGLSDEDMRCTAVVLARAKCCDEDENASDFIWSKSETMTRHIDSIVVYLEPECAKVPELPQSTDCLCCDCNASLHAYA